MEILGRNKVYNNGGGQYRNFLIPLLGIFGLSSAVKNKQEDANSANLGSATYQSSIDQAAAEEYAAQQAALQTERAAQIEANSKIIAGLKPNTSKTTPLLIIGGGLLILAVGGFIAYKKFKK